MRSINKVIIIGNLTRDPEMRQTPNGQSVTTFGIATNREWMTKESERKSSAEFHECVAWARLAEICSQYIKKGSLVYVEGYLKTRSWDTDDGTRKFKTEIVVQDMIMLEKRKDGEGDFVPSSNENGPSGKADDSKEEPKEEEKAEEPKEEPKEEEKAEEPKEETKEEEKTEEPKEEPKEEEKPEEPKEEADEEEKGENPIDKDLGL